MVDAQNGSPIKQNSMTCLGFFNVGDDSLTGVVFNEADRANRRVDIQKHGVFDTMTEEFVEINFLKAGFNHITKLTLKT